MSDVASADSATTAGLPSAAVSAPAQSGRGSLDSATVLRLVTGLWLLWALCLFGGTILSEFVRAESVVYLKDQILLFAHLGSSVLLAIAAWIWVLEFNRSSAATTVALLAAGMTLGLIGDFFNGGVLQQMIKLPDPALGGIAAFALGHVAYITACRRVARTCHFQDRGKFWVAIAFWQAFGLVAWFFVVYRGTNPRATVLVVPALPYSLLLAGTAGMASYLALENRRFARLAVGAILFLFSDLILAFRMFHGEFPLASHAVWLVYGPAQMLIVYSIGIVGHSETDRVATGIPTN
jgi:hypothetical protein